MNTAHSGKPLSIPSVEFPFDTVLDDLDGHDAAEDSEPDLSCWMDVLGLIVRLFQWVDQGRLPVEKTIRLKVILGLLTNRSQQDMAITIGVTRAAVSRLANEFFVDFTLTDRERLIAHMRSSETAAQFSEQCKQRHQLRRSKISHQPNQQHQLEPACN